MKETHMLLKGQPQIGRRTPKHPCFILPTMELPTLTHGGPAPLYDGQLEGPRQESGVSDSIVPDAQVCAVDSAVGSCSCFIVSSHWVFVAAWALAFL